MLLRFSLTWIFSPEAHPLYPSNPDLTLYLFDPRETSLRRSRTSTSSFPAHLRSSLGSSPISSPSSPSGSTSMQSLHAHDVWTGKGLVSWALDEPGQGKQLVTGRLIQSPTFAQVADDTGSQGLEGLAALLNHGSGDVWGIEVSLSLKSGNAPSTHHHLPQIHHLVSRGGRSSIGSASDLAALSDAIRPSSPAISSLPSRVPLRPMTTIAAKPAVKPLLPARRVSSASDLKKQPIKRVASAAGRKKKYPDTHSHSTSHGKVASDVASKSGNTSSDGESFPGDIPAQLYSDPESLTKEQAERLLESPAFLSMLSRLTGQPIQPAENSATRKIRLNRKRQAEEQVKKEEEQSSKKAKVAGVVGQGNNAVAGPSGTKPKTPSKDDGQAALKCFNCGRTKSAVWRTKVMEDGNSVRVCNGALLYVSHVSKGI